MSLMFLMSLMIDVCATLFHGAFVDLDDIFGLVVDLVN